MMYYRLVDSVQANTDRYIQDRTRYTHRVKTAFCDVINTQGPTVPLVSQLRNRRGLAPEDVKTIICSHAHW